jgi:hypothetical protein
MKLPLVVLPLSMVSLNIGFLVVTLLGEYRLKPNCLRFAAMYAGTIWPTLKGDIGPFVAVLSMPPA